jgi:hypothetical protein
VYRNKDTGFQDIIKGIGNELGRGLVCRPNGATNEEESQIYIRNKVYAIVHERRIQLRKTIEDEQANVERYRLQVIRKEAQLARCEKIHENAEKEITTLGGRNGSPVSIISNIFIVNVRNKSGDLITLRKGDGDVVNRRNVDL